MATKLTADRIHLGADACYVGQSTSFGNKAPEFRAAVFGHQFGSTFFYVGGSLEEAFDEWDERHGERVNVADDAATLADYKGETTEEQIEDAMGHGDIRITGSGTMVRVDPYEWVRTFDGVREAARFFREN